MAAKKGKANDTLTKEKKHHTLTNSEQETKRIDTFIVIQKCRKH